jgi:hypothetical protein
MRTPEERAAKEAAQAAAMPGPASVVTLSRDQAIPPIVDQAEWIVAKYNQLDPDRQACITKFVDYLIAKQDTE